jgi:ribosomal-protein-alanine N-acetyltransferase
VRPRAATEADAAAIAAVESAAAHTPWDVASVRERLGAPTTVAFVIGDPVLGHVLTTCVAEEAEILTLAVHPAARRRGLATDLLAACAALWAERGVTAAWLEVRDDNHAARALYRNQGWVEAGTRPRYYVDGTDARIMRWSPVEAL